MEKRVEELFPRLYDDETGELLHIDLIRRIRFISHSASRPDDYLVSSHTYKSLEQEISHMSNEQMAKPSEGGLEFVRQQTLFGEFDASYYLNIMKEIYKYVKDDSLKKKLKEVQGIGTEATRASIIDELIKRKFLIEEGKKKFLVPTPNAYLLVDALPDEMVYPDETAIWEERLHLMGTTRCRI